MILIQNINSDSVVSLSSPIFGKRYFFSISKNLHLKFFKNKPYTYSYAEKQKFTILDKRSMSECFIYVSNGLEALTLLQFFMNSKNERGYVKKEYQVVKDVFYISFSQAAESKNTLTKKGFYRCVKKLENQCKKTNK